VFDPSPAGEVDDGQLASVLSAGSWATSSGNSQPWAFLVLRRGT